MFWDAVNLLGTVGSFQSLPFRLLGRARTVFSLGLIIPHYWCSALLSICHAAREWSCFLVWLAGTGTNPGSVCVPGTVPSDRTGSSHTHALISTLLSTPGELPLQISGACTRALPLSLCSSLLNQCVLPCAQITGILADMVFLAFQLCFFWLRICHACLGSFLVRFLSLRDRFLCCIWCPVSCKPEFHIYIIF